MTVRANRGLILGPLQEACVWWRSRIQIDEWVRRWYHCYHRLMSPLSPLSTIPRRQFASLEKDFRKHIQYAQKRTCTCSTRHTTHTTPRLVRWMGPLPSKRHSIMFWNDCCIFPSLFTVLGRWPAWWWTEFKTRKFRTQTRIMNCWN